MASNSSWTPDKDSQTLLSERYYLQGVIITAIVYGITVSLYLLSFYHLVRGKNHVELKRRLPLLIYITVAFLLVTVFMITVTGYTQMAFIDYRNYPGGPVAFENEMFHVPIDNAGVVVYIISNCFSDALVVWRFKIIYQMFPVSTWALMFLPCLSLAGSAAMGIMFLIQYPTATVYSRIMYNSGLPFLGLSLALNIILTIAIVLRLLALRRHIVSLLGPKYGTQYTSVAAMIIESAALYSAVSVVSLVLYGIGNTVYLVFLPSLIQFQTVATLLIVFRVARGKGWTQNTAIYAMSGMDRSELNNTQPASAGVFGVPNGSREAVQGSGGGESQHDQQAPNKFPVLRDTPHYCRSILRLKPTEDVD